MGTASQADHVDPRQGLLVLPARLAPDLDPEEEQRPVAELPDLMVVTRILSGRNWKLF